MTTTYSNNGQVTNFWPDDTENTMYLYGEHTFSEIMDICKQKFGENIDFAHIKIEYEYIHTRCLGFDSYDSSDWDTFTVIHRIKSYQDENTSVL